MNLKWERLTRAYGAKVALDLGPGEIAGGRITGIIGPNGAGKSTLLNIIAGLDVPDSGRVMYGAGAENDETRYCEDTPRERITLIFQQPYMLHTTVEKNIAYPLKLRKTPPGEIKRRADELMEELGLAALAKQKAWRLSGGEMQKTAFARAMSFNPELLLLDEPTSNIDNATTADIETLLRRAKSGGGVTVVIVSHDLAQIKRLCDDVIFINRGKIVEAGTADVILKNPLEADTRTFIEGGLLL
jgi:tungstate transport system ATP-binding protein